MAIAIGDILILPDSNWFGVVVSGDAAAGWGTLIAGGGAPTFAVITDAAALNCFATFIPAPVNAPAIGTVGIQATETGNAHTYIVDGYATSPFFGAGVIFGLLLDGADPGLAYIAFWNAVTKKLSFIP